LGSWQVQQQTHQQATEQGVAMPCIERIWAAGRHSSRPTQAQTFFSRAEASSTHQVILKQGVMLWAACKAQQQTITHARTPSHPLHKLCRCIQKGVANTYILAMGSWQAQQQTSLKIKS
jgi:hypothetical protein